MKSERRTVLQSFRDAFRGIWDCVKSERNMRIHLTACCYVMFFAFRMGLTRGEKAVLLLTIGAVMGAEAMNTAVEKLCDFIQPKQNTRIRFVKDVAAGAVALTALAAVGVGLAVFLRPELWQTLRELLTSPLSAVLLALSVAAALAFILLGPSRIAAFFRKSK